MADYVLRAKRRRIVLPACSPVRQKAVDPCLGYYISKAHVARPSSPLEMLRKEKQRIYAPSPKGSIPRENIDLHAHAGLPLNLAIPTSDESKRELLVPRTLSSASHLRSLPGYGDDSVETTVKDLAPASVDIQPKTPRRFLAPEAAYTQVVQATGTRETVDNQEAPDTSPARPATPPPKVLTIEDFLKRSSGSTVQRRYGKKKGRKPKRVILSSDGVAGPSQLRSQDPNRQTDPAVPLEEKDDLQLRTRKIARGPISDESSSITGLSSPLATPKKQRKSAPNKSLKERIYAAAVATYVDPDPTFLRSSSQNLEDGRVALRFVPEPESSTKQHRDDSTGKRKQSRKLVDPRKSTAIRTASFSSRIRPHQWPLIGDRPIGTTALKLDVVQEGTHHSDDLDIPPPTQDIESDTRKRKRSNETAKGSSSTKKAFTYAPLNFVPLDEAEDGYAAMFHVREETPASELRGRKLTGAVPASSLHFEPLIKRSSAVESQSSHHKRLHIRGKVALELEKVNNGYGSPRDPRSTLVEPESRMINSDLPSDNPCPDPFPIVSPVLSTPLEKAVPQPKEVTPIPCSDSTSRVLLKTPPPRSENHTQQAPQKLLKPLGSFMDGILATMQSLTGHQTRPERSPGSTKSKRARPSTVHTRRRRLEVTAPLSEEHATLAAHRLSRNEFLEEPKSQSAQHIPSRRYPSPDIWAILNSAGDQYQVVISSDS